MSSGESYFSMLKVVSVVLGQGAKGRAGTWGKTAERRAPPTGCLWAMGGGSVIKHTVWRQNRLGFKSQLCLLLTSYLTWASD